MQKGKYYLGSTEKNALGGNRLTAKMHFSNALKILNGSATPDHAEFIMVYNGLMHVDLDLTFQSDLGIGGRERHLQMAVAHNNQSWEIAQNFLVDNSGILAQVKLQRAVLYGRKVQLRAKFEGDDRRGSNLKEVRDKAIEGIERALREVLESNHKSKEKSITWGKEWQSRLKKL